MCLIVFRREIYLNSLKVEEKLKSEKPNMNIIWDKLFKKRDWGKYPQKI